MYHAQKARACKRIVEKSPHHYRYISNILSTFPKAKIIYIYRHPMGVFSSYKRREKCDSEFAGITHQRFCIRYRKSVNIVLESANRKKESIYLVRYEAFTQTPESEFHKICEFLGEPFEKEAVKEKNPDLSKWKPDPYLFGPITLKTKDWRDYCALDEARYIENGLKLTMQKLNYISYLNCW